MPNPNAGVFQKIREELVTANEHHTAGTQEIVQLRTTFEKMMDVEKQAKLDQLEAMRENTKESVSGAGLAGAGAEMGGAVKEKSGGLLGKLLGGGLMVAAAAGLAAIVAGIMAFMNLDVDGIIANVKKLFSINDLVDGVSGALVEGGTFFLVMTGLGLGLAIFGIGSAIAGLSSALGNFLDPNWAQGIVDNVKVLLGLGAALGGDILKTLGETGVFLAVMTGVGLGLAIFGIGSAIAGLSSALTNFVDSNWAQGIVDNVVTLLSIKDELGGAGAALAKGGVFLGVMTGVGLGLAIFGLGSAVAGLSDAMLNFTNPNWASSIVNNVITLLSIKDQLGGAMEALGETGTFFLVMTGVSAGLAVFAVGQAAAGIADFFFGDSTKKIVNNVITLIGIKDTLGGNPVKAATDFKTSLTLMGQALANFAASQADAGWSALKDSLMGFFGGGSAGPMDQLLKLGKNQEELFLAGVALDQLADGLERISSLKLDGDYMSLNEFAEDMLKSVPAIETALMGGTVGKGWVSSGTKIKGLASPDVDFEKAAANIKLIQAALKAEQTAEASAYSNDAQASAAPPIINNVTNNYYSGGGSNTTMIAPNASAVQDARKLLTR